MKKKNRDHTERPDEFSSLEDFQQVWDKTDLKSEEFLPDADKAWERLQWKAQYRASQKSYPWLKIAAVITLIIAASVIWKWLPFQSFNNVALITNTAADTTQLITLADGSQIWLKEGSEIQFPEEFLNNREIYLKGEAFFEVAKRNGQPFTIYTATSKTEVLGTSFLLKEVENGKAEIQVTTGRVEFSNLKNDQQIILTPGLQAQVDASDHTAIIPETIKDVNYRAWQNNVLIFNNASLDQIVKTLSAHFEKDVTVDHALNNCRFTVSFENQSLQDILDIITITGNFQISQHQNNYHITGTPCL